MSEETLRRLLERLNTDEAFREKMREEWADAIGDLGLSRAELVALSTDDEDALRRLVGAEVTAYSQNFFGTQLICTFACPITLDTPGSGRDTCPGSRRGCGTGGNCRDTSGAPCDPVRMA